MRAGGWALIWCPYKKRRLKHRLTLEEEGHVQAKEKPLKKQPTNTLILDLSCHNHEEINFCCLKLFAVVV